MHEAIHDVAQPAMRTLVADADENTAAQLQIMLGTFENIELIGAAQSGDQTLRMIDALSPELVLMSVQLPGRSGIQVANAVKEHASVPSIILFSASQESAFDAFEAEAVDYLLKPIRRDRLETALKRASDQRLVRPTKDAYLSELWVQQRNARICVASDDICMIEAQGDYVILHTADTNYMLHKTIKQLTEHLDPDQFIRIHRSTVIRRDAIKALVHRTASNWAVDVGNGKLHAVGKTFLPRVKALSSIT